MVEVGAKVEVEVDTAATVVHIGAATAATVATRIGAAAAAATAETLTKAVSSLLVEGAAYDDVMVEQMCQFNLLFHSCR